MGAVGKTPKNDTGETGLETLLRVYGRPNKEVLRTVGPAEMESKVRSIRNKKSAWLSQFSWSIAQSSAGRRYAWINVGGVKGGLWTPRIHHWRGIKSENRGKKGQFSWSIAENSAGRSRFACINVRGVKWGLWTPRIHHPQCRIANCENTSQRKTPSCQSQKRFELFWQLTFEQPTYFVASSIAGPAEEGSTLRTTALRVSLVGLLLIAQPSEELSPEEEAKRVSRAHEKWRRVAIHSKGKLIEFPLPLASFTLCKVSTRKQIPFHILSLTF